MESYCNWAEMWESALLHNRQLVNEWQAIHDLPYSVYKLTYVVTAAYWRSSGKSERASIWSLAPTTNEAGYWTVIEKGHALDRLYQMWISVDAETIVRPSQNHFGFILTLANAQMNVCVHPKQRYTAEELEHDLVLVPLPIEPNPPYEVYKRLYPDLANDLFTPPLDLALHEFNRRREEQGREPFEPEMYELEEWIEEDDE